MRSGRSWKNNPTLLLVLGIAGLGLYLRLWRLGQASLWFDELCTAYRAHLPLGRIFEDLWLNPFPPLYYILMHYWTLLLGNSELVLRLPSALASALSVVFVFMLAKELFGRQAGLIAAFLVGTSAYSIYYAQEAKMYSLLWCLGILSFLFFLRFMDKGKKTDLAGYLLFTGLSLYTLYVGFIFVIVQNIVFFGLPGPKKARSWCLAQLALLVSYLPWMERLLYHLRNETGTYWIPQTAGFAKMLLESTIPAIISGPFFQHNAVELGIYSGLIIAALLKRVGKKRMSLDLDAGRNDYLLLAWIALPIGIYWLIGSFVCPVLSDTTERYVGFIHIPLLILAAKGLAKCDRRLSLALLAALAGLAIVFHLLPLYGLAYRAMHKDDYRAFQYKLKLKAPAGSLVLSELPTPIVAYYNKEMEIKPIGYLGIRHKELPASLYVVYRGAEAISGTTLLPRLKGYRLAERYYSFPNGFLRYERR